MKPDQIMKWSLERIEIPFRRPFTIISNNQSLILKTRSIALLKVTLASGLELISEAHPLPGLHSQTLEFCMQEIESFLQSKQGQDIPISPEHLAKLSGPSIVAIEGLFLSQLLPCPTHVITQSLLIPGEQNPAILKLNEYNFLKIKLGRMDFRQELEWCMDLHHALDPHVRWRFDGNQQLSPSQLEKLASMPFKSRIDYIEEPLKEFYSFLSAQNLQVCPLPFALDESLPKVLQSGPDFKRLKSSGLKALIIRPPSLGGYHSAIKVMGMTDLFNLLPVLSSSFEGPWGFEKLLRLLSLPLQSLHKSQAHGLDTLSLLNLDDLHATMPDIPFINSKE